MGEAFHGQSTKENYRVDIDDSLKQKTVYKNYEYYDDYSYSNSLSIGFLLRDYKNKKYLYLFQSNGPKNSNQIRKLLEWRRSGDSDEVGHKGGGNKRNIYGFKSSKTSLFSKIEEDQVLYCETNPNKIYDLAISDVNEDEFRSQVDTSEYIKTPELKELDDLPSWYINIYEDIMKKSDIEPNYLIRMELTDIPIEYSSKDKWNEYLKQVRAKQYDIPLYFKNELLSMETYEKYDNIDLIGLHGKENEKIIKIFIHKDNLSFYIQNSDKYINVLNTESEGNISDLLEWGHISMFIVNESYLNKQLKIYNDGLENDRLKADDLFGVYLCINGKLTNYLPVEGKLCGESRNAKMAVKNGKRSSTNRFRMIFNPNNDSCIDPKYFNALIRSETMKALSGFLDKSPYKKIIKISMDIYKGVSFKDKSVKSPKVKTDSTKVIGGVYIVYFGYGLWKYGLIMDNTKFVRREEEHKHTSIEKVKEFLKIDIDTKFAQNMYTKDTKEPKGDEEKIKNLLTSKMGDGKITLFQNDGSQNDIREYFICKDIDYILMEIIPLLN